jgi:hypothetical protein
MSYPLLMVCGPAAMEFIRETPKIDGKKCRPQPTL